ncbi:hypothetical protein YC2023_019470 [Brassica napus]
MKSSDENHKQRRSRGVARRRRSSGMRSVSIPKAKAAFVKYHASHDVRVRLSPPSSRQNLNSKPAETPLGLKTASDCEDKLICGVVLNKMVKQTQN